MAERTSLRFVAECLGLLLAALLAPASATAAIVPGGGSSASDCYGAFDVRGADGASRKVACVDGDPTCDGDGQCQGTCTFDVAVCLNQAGCTPQPLAKPPAVRGATLVLPTPGATEPLCGAGGEVAVTVRGRKRTKARTKKLTLKVVTTGKPKSDKDVVVLRCAPRTDACPTTTTTLPTTTTTLPPRGAADPLVYALAPDNVLLRFRRSTPSDVTTIGTVTGLGDEQTLRGIDVRPRTGQLYGVAVTTASIVDSTLFTYVIDPTTAAATPLGATATGLTDAADVPTGLAFNPTTDRIRYVNTNDENARLNPNNAALAGNDTDLTGPGTFAAIAVAHDRSFDRQNVGSPANDAIPTTVFVIDRAGNAMDILGSVDGGVSPNGGVAVTFVPLGVDVHASRDGGFDIAPSIDGPLGLAALTSQADGLTHLYDITPTSPAATPIGFIGDGTTEILSLAIAPDGIAVTGADAGGEPRVTVFENGVPVLSFLAYPAEQTTGVRVAAGDVTGDGVPDVVTAPGPGSAPLVRVFDGATGAPVGDAIGAFLVEDPAFAGGVFVASADVDADGFDDIVTGLGPGGEPRVRVFSGRTGVELMSFLAYDPGFTGGVAVAAGDTNLDGLAEIVTGPVSGTPATVAVFAGPLGGGLDGVTATPFGADFAGGIAVAAGDVNGDGRTDVIAGAGAGGEPMVQVLSGVDGTTVLHSFLAFDAAFRGGVRVGAADVNHDGRAEILVAGGAGRPPEVRAFDGRTLADVGTLTAFPPELTGGVFVAGARP